jgi:heat shock protein HspQ
VDKEKQKEELHKQMGKVIRHSDVNSDGMVTDIDTTDQLKEPVLDATDDDEDEKKDLVMPLEDKYDLAHHHNGSQPQRITLTMAEIKHIYHDEVEKQEDSEKASAIEKIIKYITFPIDFLSMLLIPNVDKEKIDNWYCPLIPFTSMLGLITILKCSRW